MNANYPVFGAKSGRAQTFRTSVKVLLVVLIAAFSNTPLAQVSPELPDDPEDLFEHRWFTIELIVFERLAVLDLNNDETLSRSKPRSWPENLSMLSKTALPTYQIASPAGDSPGTAARQKSIGVSPIRHNLNRQNTPWLEDGFSLDLEIAYELLDAHAAECFGYPLLERADPIHPSLLPLSPVQAYANRLLAPLLPGGVKSVMQNYAVDLTDALFSAQAALQDLQPNSGQNSLDKKLNDLDPSALSQQPDIAPEPEPWLTAFNTLRQQADEFEAELIATSFMNLSDYQLTDAVKAINRRSALRPVLHKRWTQPVPERSSPIPLMIETPLTPGDGMTTRGHAKISGYLDVTVQRYLHVSSRIWYQSDTLGQRPVLLGLQTDQAASGRETGDNHLERDSVNDVASYFELNESRRMRSEELHYLDHPKFGVIIRIDPLVIPDPLATAFTETKRLLDEAP
ncbi:MAG: CsiV family protein [Pseudomonadota bacterium]